MHKIHIKIEIEYLRLDYHGHGFANENWNYKILFGVLLCARLYGNGPPSPPIIKIKQHAAMRPTVHPSRVSMGASTTRAVGQGDVNIGSFPAFHAPHLPT